MNGGVLQARSNQSDFLANFETGDVVFGTNGAFLDTQAFSVGIAAPLGGAGGLTKQGTGTLTLNGSNSYSGETIVEEGALLVDGSLASEVSVSTGAAIGGGGTINADLSLASGAYFVFNLATPLTVTGSVTLDSTFGIASVLGLDDTVAEGTYVLIDGTSTDFSALGLQNWGSENAYDLGGGKSAYFKQGSLEVQVVPEPGTWALVVVGGLAALLVHRRRRV